jgi:hypothetical protein
MTPRILNSVLRYFAMFSLTPSMTGTDSQFAAGSMGDLKCMTLYFPGEKETRFLYAQPMSLS